MKGNALISPEYVPHGRKDYEIDSRPVRIGRGRQVRHRPHLSDWKLCFAVQLINDNAVPKKVLHDVLVKAGQTVGIGDYRPRYGRFIVTKFQEVKTADVAA